MYEFDFYVIEMPLARLNDEFEEAVGQELRLTSRKEQLAAARKLKDFYFQNKTIDKSQLYELSLVCEVEQR